MTTKAVSTFYYFGKQRFQSEDEAFARRLSHGEHGSHFTERAIESLHRLIPSGSVLDLACGNGRNLPLLGARFSQTFGGDISGPMLKVARQLAVVKADIPLAQLEAENLPFANDSFDGIFCARFFHHLPTFEIRQRILSEIFRVAREGAVVTFKSRFSPEHVRYTLRRRLPSRGARAHRYFVNKNEFQSVAEACGWRLVQIISSRGIFSSNQAAIFKKD